MVVNNCWIISVKKTRGHHNAQEAVQPNGAVALPLNWNFWKIGILPENAFNFSQLAIKISWQLFRGVYDISWKKMF